MDDVERARIPDNFVAPDALSKRATITGMNGKPAEVVRQYGPFRGVDAVHGVSFDGSRLWFASGEYLHALNADSGEVVDVIKVAAQAGTAFDGKYIHQIADGVIRRIDPRNGEILGTIPAPGDGADSGLAWAEGSLWVGQGRERTIKQIDPETGVVLRTIESDRFVTGVTWVGDQLWHGTWEDGTSDVRRIDPRTAQVCQRIDMPAGTGVSGLESAGDGVFACGGGPTGNVTLIRRR